MPVAGLDVHKRVVEAVILDEDGRPRHRARFPCDRVALETFARTHLSPAHRVALEATTNTWGITAILQPWVGEVVVSNPRRTRAIAEAKIKTDHVDALVLAQLLRCDYLPRVWQPDPATQALRHLTSRRAALVARRTGIKNRIHAVFHELLLAPPVRDLFGVSGRMWLRGVPLPPLARAAVDCELRLLEAVDSELATLTQHLAQRAHGDPQVRLLMTLPGVDVAVAQMVLATLGDVTRFRDGAHAAAYVGLVPATFQSAAHTYHGPITKQGKGHARWLLVQAAQHLGTHPGPLGVFFRRLARRKNRNVAVVATARKLVVIAWHMLRRQEPYRYALPRATAVKLARLRIAATGRRRAGGIPRGAPRPAAYGTGVGTFHVPSLAEVCARESLPPPQPLTPGERRVVTRTGTTALVAELAQSYRACRGRSARTRPPEESS